MNKKMVKKLVFICVLTIVATCIPIGIQVGANDTWAVIDKDTFIDLNSSDYFGGKCEAGTSPTEGYYGADENFKYVYAGGANNLVADKVKIDGERVDGYQVKTAVDQMMGIRIKAGATVTLYYAAGGANRSIYMIDKQVAYGKWEDNGVTIFESAPETETTISHTFDSDTDVYFAASAPCYIAHIDVSYPATGERTLYLGFDGNDANVSMSGNYTYTTAHVGDGVDLDGGVCSVGAVNITENLTAAAWVKPKTLSDNMSLFKFNDANGNSFEYILNNSKGRTQLNISTQGSLKTVEFTSPFKENRWTHLAITIKNQIVTIYIDGVQTASETVTIKPTLTDGSGVIGGNGFLGTIDEFQIFNYAFSNDQIKELINAEAQEINSVENVKITARSGTRPNMPSAVEVVYANGMKAYAAVDWDEFETPIKEGVYTINGTVNAQGKTAAAQAEITVESDSINSEYSVAQNIDVANTAGIYRIDADYKIVTENNTKLDGYLAIYDSVGNMLDCAKNSVVPDSESVNQMNMSLDVAPEAIANGAKAKIYLWNSETQEPITNPSERELSRYNIGNYADTTVVNLESDSLFDESAQIGYNYLIGVDVDRLIAPLYEVHGLNAPNNAERYAGWETQNGNKTLAGHSLGHWMSAAAVMYRENGDEELLEMLNYSVDKLCELQETTGSGYIGGCGIEAFDRAFAGIPNWTEGGYWVPWYGVHKIYQGLIDAYYYTGNLTALDTAIRFADWAAEGLSKLSYDQIQAMISVEYGGMNEVFAELYEITGNEIYEKAARDFTQDSLLTPLSQGRDNLSGKHANTQIPKVLGAAKLYELNPDKYADYKTAAENFWDYVVNDRSYAIGGNAIAEHFEELGAETLGIKTCESCNTYNMLKLTECLYAWDHKSEYMDYYETALYNHILGQQDPDTGSKEYFISLLPGHHRIYEEKYNSWWCCTGTGMENPGRYTRNIYYEEGSSLYVNLYMPGKYVWEDKNIQFLTETDYPYSDKVHITITSGSENAELKFRVPSWCSNMTAEIDGEVYQANENYLSITRDWDSGDEILITIPMETYIYTQRAEGKIVYKYGPVVLASELGSVEGVPGVKEYNSRERDLDSVTVDVPYIISGGESLGKILEPVDTSSLTFKIPAEHSSTGEDIILRPFYEIHHQFYNVYWDVDGESDAYEKELNDVTVDRVEPDGQQDELAHDMTEVLSYQGSFAVGTKTYFYREAYGNETAEFTYNLTSNSDTKYLFARYWGGDGTFTDGAVTYDRNFNIYIDGTKIAFQTLDNEDPDNVYDVFYEIPSELVAGKDNITVRFAADGANNCAGKVIELRTVTDRVDRTM